VGSVIWAIFLRRVAGLDLAIVPEHPDGAGGLDFLSVSPQAFSIFVFALASVLAGAWGNAFLHEGVNPAVHRNAFVAFVVLNVVILVAAVVPLPKLLGQLAKALL